MFRTRVRLTVLDLSPDADRAEIIRSLARDAVASDDGYVAREVLAHTACSEQMNENDRHLLSEAISTAGLGRGDMPSALKRKLLDAVRVGGAAAERVVYARSTSTS
ncbi:hypothetical protein [Streptomyces sp. NPDC088141]|uniref:hypothetical protein n=1 Tax=unclassified Streptomyces TaxID=2593676 RepID=UPI00341DEA69